MEAKVYNQQGNPTGTVALPESIFGVAWNDDLVHQVVVSMMSNARQNIAHTKTRGEVSGTGKKPWKQKGTGQARHGSRRSPIWVGGGVAHGPRNDKDYGRKVNKKMKAKALYAILSRKLKDGEVLFVDTFELSEKKTTQAKEILKSLSRIEGFSMLLSKKKNSAYVALSGKDANVEKSFANFSNIHVDEIRNVNPIDILQYKYLVISRPETSVDFLQSKLSSK
jgi:large subunit ribosomal protein L4